MLPAPLGDLLVPPAWRELLTADAKAPVARREELRVAVRELLRHGGYKPTGRGKPSAEYLLRAASEGSLASINFAVDACNIVSLHSGLPISVVDLDRVVPPLSIGIAPTGSRYVFNNAGQEIDVEGLLCLRDAEGPCANAVKDCQRTKTHAATRRTLSLIWGTQVYAADRRRAVDWYRKLVSDAGATTEEFAIVTG